MPEPAEITDTETTLPERLPELVEAYRLTLIEELHVVPFELAEQYTDAEIGSLKRKFAGQDDALFRELASRMRDAQPHYGTPTPAAGIKPVYPDDQESAR